MGSDLCRVVVSSDMYREVVGSYMCRVVVTVVSSDMCRVIGANGAHHSYYLALGVIRCSLVC